MEDGGVNATTEDRLAKLEDRLDAIERIVREAQAKVDAFAKGPGKKFLGMLGLDL